MNLKHSGLSGNGLSSLNSPDVKSTLGELKNSLEEMKNSAAGLTASPGSGTTLVSAESRNSSSSTTSSSSSFHRSMSAAANINNNSGGPLKLQNLKRNETSPSIMEMPSSAEIDIDDASGGGDSSPIVTSPLSELTEVDLNFNNNNNSNGQQQQLAVVDPDNNPMAVALTSPNLVSCMNSGGLTLSNASPLAKMSNLTAAITSSNTNSYSQETRKSSSSKTTKIVTDKFSSESATASAAQTKRVQAGDVRYEENMTSSATKGRLEKDGIVAEKESGLKHASRTSRISDVVQSESATAAMTGNRLHVVGGAFSAENVSTATSTSRSLLDSASGKFTSESHASEATSKKMSVTSGGVTHTSQLMSANEYTSMVETKMSKEEVSRYLTNFDDLDRLGNTTNIKDVEKALVKYCGVVSNTVEQLKNENNEDSLAKWFLQINNMMTRASGVPKFGERMGSTLAEIMRNNGGMDIVMDKLTTNNTKLQYNSAKLVHKVLETDNRGYVVEKGLDKAVEVAKKYTRPEVRDVKQTRLGTGILENLFKHNEATCENVIAKGGLDTVVNECQSQDVETLRHCASALANAAMFGGAENQGLMIQRKVPTWLFPLAFHNDPTIKYYACLAIAVLVANKENEAAVKKSGILDLVDSFISNQNPADFAELTAKKTSGQSANWLRRLIPVLSSQREEARNLAAFHFCMEAELKAKHGMTEIFEEIGAVDALKRLASSPNGIASKYAAKALRTVGVEVPHKLSQQVPNWSVEDVMEWVKQIGFPQFSEAFMESRVDGDLLLQLTEEMLREDIQMRNGILRRRFLRELSNLRKRTDYSSIDPTGLNEFLQSLGQEYSIYTYEMLNKGIDRDTLLSINDEQLLLECGIDNKIHRIKIQQGVKVERGDISYSEESLDKNLDVFISYRRSNGAQLASLLKVHLELREYSVFLDVVGLEAGKFDNNLLQNIRTARNFILVCTANAMDRCVNDHEQKDWIHKEVHCALQSQCNIIPVFDNFLMPEPELLPETMRAVTSYNGVKWIHDYQDACVEKIVRFIAGDGSLASSALMERFLAGSASSSQYSYGRQNTYQRTISEESNTPSTRSEDAGNPASSSLHSQ